MLNSTGWDCIHHENIDESHLNGYGLHVNRTGSINLAKNLISGIRKFRYDLDSKNNKKKLSLATSVRNTDQLELDSSFKSDLVKSSVGQPDDDMLGLRKLRIKNPNEIMMAHLNINSIRNKFESSVKWGHLAHLDPNSTNTISSSNPMGSSSPL